MHESCAIFGIYSPNEDVARITFFGLFALQHRGQESSGIATANGKKISIYTGMGRVSNVFSEESLSKLAGHIAIGHNRYSTSGSSRAANAQPIVVGNGNAAMAIAHNGNIVNARYLQQELVDQGYTFRSGTDTEVVANLILSCPEYEFVDKIKYAMGRLQGAYSMVVNTRNELYAIRDPFGVRPLAMGKLDGGFVVASETCALDHIGAESLEEIKPGEIFQINENGVQKHSVASPRSALCVFEYIYFARPDSVINGKLLYPVRQNMGFGLAREHDVDADMVMGVPDSATAAAMGYAQGSGIPIAEGLIKNRYVGRTFIEPDQRMRDLGVKMKFNPLPQMLDDRRLVVVDDSIVRGTTTPSVVKLLRKAGAKEVHMRICAPPIKYPCFFGVDMATRGELIAAKKSIPEICEFIGADSLGYLSIEGLVAAVGLPKSTLCLACFTGNYPIPVQLEMDKLALEQKAAVATGEFCDAIEDA